jgi:hypothetical protein
MRMIVALLVEATKLVGVWRNIDAHLSQIVFRVMILRVRACCLEESTHVAINT